MINLSSQATRLRLNNATLFDGEHHFPHERHSVVVEGSRIVDVGRATPPSLDERIIDLQGMTLMPGLIDAHFHCNSPSLKVGTADQMPPSQLAQYARKYIEAALRQGFTTLRDAGGADVGLARAVEEGIILGPRLFVAGLALSQTGGHGDMRDGIRVCGCMGYSGSLSRVVDGADNIRLLVREQLRTGVNQIKIFVTGGVLSPTDPIWMEQFTDEEIRAAVEEASRRQTYVMAHALTAKSVRRCVDLGVRSIEHALQMDSATADYVAASESFVVATLQIVAALANGQLALPPGAVEKARQVADQAMAAIEFGHRAGVRFGLGTDLLGELHGLELQEFVIRAGVSGTLETLRSATSINAEIMNMKGQLGTVRRGALADLIVVDGDPLADISVLTDPERTLKFLMKNGRTIINRLKCDRDLR